MGAFTDGRANLIFAQILVPSSLLVKLSCTLQIVNNLDPAHNNITRRDKGMKKPVLPVRVRWSGDVLLDWRTHEAVPLDTLHQPLYPSIDVVTGGKQTLLRTTWLYVSIYKQYYLFLI